MSVSHPVELDPQLGVPHPTERWEDRYGSGGRIGRHSPGPGFCKCWDSSLDDTKYGLINTMCPFAASHSENILFNLLKA